MKCNFDHFQESRKSFSKLFKVVFELFNNALGIVFVPERLSVLDAYELERLISRFYNQNFLLKFWPAKKVIGTIFGLNKPVFWTFLYLIWSCPEVV